MKNVMEPVTRFDLDEALEIQDEKSRGYRDQILTGLDKVVKELETIIVPNNSEEIQASYSPLILP